MERVVKVKYEIGDIVELKGHTDKFFNRTPKAIVLGFEDYKLFPDSVKCVKVMVMGASEPTYTLSDRIRKL